LVQAHKSKTANKQRMTQAYREFMTRQRATACVVLGHASYYPRHGFERASTRGLRWERPAPEASFFVQELAPDGLQGVSGSVRYRRELDEL